MAGTYMNPGIAKNVKPQTPDDLIKKQFAGLRTQARTEGEAAGEAAKRQLELKLGRAENAGGGFGGARLKMQTDATADLDRNIQRDISSQQAGLGAQEAATQLQESMFSREFKENQKTNMLNALVEMKKAKLLGGGTKVQEYIQNYVNRFQSGGLKATPGVSFQTPNQQYYGDWAK